MNRVIDWSAATVLTAAELDVALDLLDLDPAPAALDLCSHGVTAVERAQVVRDALASLRARGLFDRGRLLPALAEDLRTLTSADLRRELFVAEPYAQRAVVGARGGSAVLVVRVDEEVALVRLEPSSGSAALVELLGPLVPGPGPAVRVPLRTLLDALRACAGDRSRIGAELLRRGASGAETTQVERMADLYGMAELAVARGGPDPCRGTAFVLVLATPHGHYLQLRPAPDRLGGAPSEAAVVRAGPADRPALVAELDRLADALGNRSTPADASR